MRLLLRANTHRRIDDGCREVAASPDTPGRERWLWQVRLLDAAYGPSDVPLPRAHHVTESLAPGVILEVVAAPAKVSPTVEVLGLGTPSVVGRERDEIVVLLACGGQVLVEDRHLLADEDALVLAGDDPLGVSVRCPPDSRSKAAMVRLRPADGRVMAWVP
ncbi:hypothetical protein [Streptomyces sp. NPDC002403]